MKYLYKIPRRTIAAVMAAALLSAAAVVAVAAPASAAPVAVDPNTIISRAIGDATAQGKAQDHSLPRSTPTWKVLFLGFTDVTTPASNPTRQVMDANDRVYLQNIANNFAAAINEKAGVRIQPTVKFSTAPLNIPGQWDRVIHEGSIPQQLKDAAGVGEYDSIIVTSKGNNGGVSAGYAWDDAITRGSSYSYAALSGQGAKYPAVTNRYDYATIVALHEFGHQMEANWARYPMPQVHGASGYGYTLGDPNDEWAPFYLDLLSGNVKGGDGARIGMYPKMWSTGPRFFHRPAMVTVHFVDQSGRAIAPDADTFGPGGDPYAITAPDISGFTATGQVAGGSAPASGTFVANARQDVTLVYRATAPTGSGAITPPVAAQGGPTGLLTNPRSARCLDVTGGSAADLTPVTLWDCNNHANQRWTRTAAGELRGLGGKCLDVNGGFTANGTGLILFTCNGGPNQRFTFTPDGSLVGAQSGRCVDLFGNGTANGTAPVIWDCNGQSNQKWTWAGTGPQVSLALAAAPAIAADGAKQVAITKKLASGESLRDHLPINVSEPIKAVSYLVNSPGVNVALDSTLLGRPFAWNGNSAGVSANGDAYTITRISNTQVRIDLTLGTPKQNDIPLDPVGYRNSGTGGHATVTWDVLTVTPAGAAVPVTVDGEPTAVSSVTWGDGGPTLSLALAAAPTTVADGTRQVIINRSLASGQSLRDYLPVNLSQPVKGISYLVSSTGSDVTLDGTLFGRALVWNGNVATHTGNGDTYTVTWISGTQARIDVTFGSPKQSNIPLDPVGYVNTRPGVRSMVAWDVLSVTPATASAPVAMDGEPTVVSYVTWG